MAIGSLDFPKHLSSASVDAVVYGEAYSAVVNRTVPAISLVAQDATELARAFEMFNAWSKVTDPDSVEIDFVFRKAGGYVLAISPEPSRLQQRCLGFDRAHRPVALGATWLKSIDSVSPLLLQIRKYCAATIAPLLFDGVVYINPRAALRASSLPILRAVPGLTPLLKFDVAFIDEDAVTPGTVGWVALNATGRTTVKTVTEPPKPRPVDIARQRITALSCHFPVTLERMQQSRTIPDLMRRLIAEGVRDWQVEQAICNIVLRRDMERNTSYVALKGRKAEDAVYNALRDRYELADGQDVPMVAEEEIREQIVADGLALLDFLKKQSAHDLASIQAALQSISALEGAPVISYFQADGAATQ
jgi:hypothetical protein